MREEVSGEGPPRPLGETLERQTVPPDVAQTSGSRRAPRAADGEAGGLACSAGEQEEGRPLPASRRLGQSVIVSYKRESSSCF